MQGACSGLLEGSDLAVPLRLRTGNAGLRDLNGRLPLAEGVVILGKFTDHGGDFLIDRSKGRLQRQDCCRDFTDHSFVLGDDLEGFVAQSFSHINICGGDRGGSRGGSLLLIPGARALAGDRFQRLQAIQHSPGRKVLRPGCI